MRVALPVGFGALFTACLLCAIGFQQWAFLAIPFGALLLVFTLLNPSMAWYALLFLLPLSAEIQFSDSLGTDIPDEPLMLLLTGIFLLASLSGRLKNYGHLVRSPVFFIVMLLLGWAVCSMVFSTSPLVSLKYMLAKCWYIVPFMLMPFFLLSGKQHIVKMAVVLLVPMLLAVLYILLRHAQQGFLFDNANHVVKPFFRNHVNYAAMLVCLLPVLYFLASGTTNRSLRRWLYGAMFIFLVALFFSYSRGAWLALATGLLAALFTKMRWLPQAFVISIAVMIGVTAWLANNNRYLYYHHNYKKTIYHASFGDHMQATFQNKDLSNAERVYRWIAALRMAGDRPITGFGAGTFYDNYQPYGVSYFKTWVSDNPERSTVHNYFLLLLTEQGIPALLLFLLLLYVLFTRLQRLYHRHTDVFYRNTDLCTAIVLTMIVTVNMLSDLVETDKMGSLFYLCCGLTIVLERKKNEAVE
ncbi:MAG: O-antigen ligase family protein [Dinghuibacter sp.]|nr:O-antigen ligase family protein [Dinghuibacter sp.]